MKKCSGSNEKGLTLVEVLAALVILGILFVGIMTIFPQMTLFNEKTEAKLDTMNLARQEMAAITAQDKWKKDILIAPVDPVTNIPEFLKPEKIKDVLTAPEYGYSEVALTNPTEFLRFEKINDYKYEVDIYTECELFLNTSSTVGSCEETERNKLYKIHLKILKESIPGSNNYTLSSETFSYLNYKAVNEPPLVSGGG